MPFFRAGGGVALLEARKALSTLKLKGDEAIGASLLSDACAAPLVQIADNGGLEGGVILQQVLNAKQGYGLNGTTGEIEDLVKAGVIDPAKVVRCALQNAVSVASMIITTTCLITDLPEKDDQANQGHGHPHAH